MPSIHDTAAVDGLASARKLDPYHIRRLRNAIYKQHRSWSDALQELPAEHRAAFAKGLSFAALGLRDRHDSQVDRATKLIFETTDGSAVEAVIMRIAGGRTTLCVSSQVGCAVGCPFCATGSIRPVRNLTSPEILDQLIEANRLLVPEKRSVRNVVFMGMGEPLHNEEAVYASLDVLHAPGCFNLPPKRTMMSTSGIPDAMVRFATRFPSACLAVSLHSAREEVRRQLVPIASRYDLAELREAMIESARLQSRSVMVEYLMLDGVNDSAEDLEMLVEYLEGVPSRINLLPYNPAPKDNAFRGSDRRVIRNFSDSLKQAGFKVTTRRSFGADVAAGCGQLAGRK